MKEQAEEWKQLCEQAAIEQDPKKLHELIRRINDLLEQKQKEQMVVGHLSEIRTSLSV